MSYDIYATIDTGGSEPVSVAEVGNMTCNVSCMWTAAVRAAGFDGAFRDMHGKLCGDMRPILERAVTWIFDPANLPVLRQMEPENGWGSVQGAREYLQKTLDVCREHPKATLRFST